jgi:hypothetical protein
MRAVECRRGNLTLISTQHARVFEKIRHLGHFPVSKMTERERRLADELFEMDVLERTGEGISIGYETVSQPKII